MSRFWGRLAATWCAVFAALHLYWAIGGDVGLASSAGADLATRRPMSFVLPGLWGVALLSLAGVAFCVGLVRWHPHGTLRRTVILLGCLAGTALLVRGVVLEVTLLANVGGVANAVGPEQERWSLLLWNPLFVVGGLALLLATRDFRRAG